MIRRWLEQWPLLEAVLWGNTLAAYVTAVVIFGGLWVILRIVHVLLVRRVKGWARRTQTDIDDTLIRIVTSIRPSAHVALAVYFALRSLTLSETSARVVDALLLAVFVYQLVLSLQILIRYLLQRRLRRGSKAADTAGGTHEVEDRNLEAALELVNKLVVAGLWVIGVLFVLSNSGINVTSLLASLGIGGIAVALALQNVLGDLFSSFAIYLDKPFTIGDFITVGDVKGTVKYIGIKTTRLESLDGEEIILSNRELTGARVKNYARMQERRVAFTFGVNYQTSVAVVRLLPEVVAEAVAGVPHTRFSRAHFKKIGDAAFIFEVVYFVTTGSYRDYMDAQQTINVRLMEALAARGVSFAPTQLVYVERE